MLAPLLAGQTLASMDPAVMAVAAPSIRRGLRLDAGTLELAVAASVFASAVLLVVGARAGASYGPRRLFLGGLAVYTAGALGTGLAGDAATLIAARLVQGVGIAAMVPQVISIIRLHVAEGSRARAMGLYSVVLALGVALGLVLGGLLVSTSAWGPGWRLAFLAAVPIGAATLIAASRSLPRDEPVRAASADPGGAVLLPAGLGLLLISLTVGPELGWPTWAWLCLAASAAVLGGFLFVERGVAARGGKPLLDFSVLARPGVPAGMLIVFASMGAYASLQLVVSLHVQSVLGFTSL
jgi:MFS family permease